MTFKPINRDIESFLSVKYFMLLHAGNSGETANENSEKDFSSKFINYVLCNYLFY